MGCQSTPRSLDTNPCSMSQASCFGSSDMALKMPLPAHSIKVNARNHWIALQCRQIELQRVFDQPVNHQSMLRWIEVRLSTMMDLEVQTARRNGAAQPMQWGSRKAVLRCKLFIELNDGALDIGFLLSGQAVAPSPPHPRFGANPGQRVRRGLHL